MNLNISEEWLRLATEAEAECDGISAGVACLLPFDQQMRYLRQCIGGVPVKRQLVHRPQKRFPRRSRLRTYEEKTIRRDLNSGDVGLAKNPDART